MCLIPLFWLSFNIQHPTQKSKAKARASAAGRPYPNLVDNAAVMKKGGAVRDYEDEYNIYIDVKMECGMVLTFNSHELNIK